MGLILALIFAGLSFGLAIPSAGPEAATAADGKTAPAAATAEAAPEFPVEEQVATGKFLTALEVKPILNATQGSWVAVREYDGQDLLYFTHLLAWRCGLHQIRFAVNGEAEQVYDAEPCHVDSAAPNSILATDQLPFLAFPLQSIATVSVRLLYDDGTEGTASFERAQIKMP